MKWCMFFVGLMSIFLFIAVGCESDKPRETQQQPEQKREINTQAGATEDRKGRSGEITYTVPDGWIRMPLSSRMRKDQLSLPGVAGVEAAELAVFFFPGTGGTVQANLERWYGQFRKPNGSAIMTTDADSKKITVNGIPVTVVYLTGTYLKSASPMMGGTVEELPDHALLAAIAETEHGPWFFKATGPQKTVDHWRPQFDEFVQSFRYGEK